MGNNAIASNHQQNNANINITTKGSDFLWAVFAVMALSCAIFLIWAHRRPAGTRIFHYLSAVILATAATAYFTMASNLGAASIPVEYIRGGSLGSNWVSSGVSDPTRAIWYARYIDWTITTPLLLLELLLATGLPLADTFSLIFFDLLMIITGLIGALVESRYKWGYFAFGCAALVYIWYALLGPARNSAYGLGPVYHGAYIKSAIFLSVVWLVYPIIWAVADGGNLIKPDSEMVAYGILDLIAKPVFCFLHVFSLRNVDMTRLSFNHGVLGGTGGMGAGAGAGAGRFNEEKMGPMSGAGRGAGGAGTTVPMTTNGVAADRSTAI